MQAETYKTFIDKGCGRCAHFDTPDCKVNTWRSELMALRSIIQAFGLDEEMKWGVPCYTLNGKNVLNISALKNHCTLVFFKGSLIDEAILDKPGPHSQAVRYIRIHSMKDLEAKTSAIQKCVQTAIENEKAGRQVTFSQDSEPMPGELRQMMAEDMAFEMAFNALTPGRQRGYIIYFSAGKQSATRLRRIEKYYGNIMRGEGMHDHYKSRDRQP